MLLIAALGGRFRLETILSPWGAFVVRPPAARSQEVPGMAPTNTGVADSLPPLEKGGPFMGESFCLQTYARLLPSTQYLERGGRKGRQDTFVCSFKSFWECSAEKAYNAILKWLLFHGKQANNS